jgi:hypothetical protein
MRISSRPRPHQGLHPALQKKGKAVDLLTRSIPRKKPVTLRRGSTQLGSFFHHSPQILQDLSPLH